MNNENIVKIFKDKKVQDLEGNWHKLNSNIDFEEGCLIQDILTKHPEFIKTIEIGFARGISSLFITNCIKERRDYFHTIIDPYQTSDWNAIGLANLKRAGINNFLLIEKPSEIALPELLSKGESFDFALIDGWNTFDHTLIDFFIWKK